MPPAIAIAGLAVSAAGTAASYAGASQNASAQRAYQNAQYQAVKKAATANYEQQVATIGTRTNQDIAQTQQQANADLLSGEKAKAAGASQFADRGVQGNSVNALLADFGRIEANNQATLDTNLHWREQQYGQDELAARAEAQREISGAAPAPVAMPSALAAGLQIGGSSLSTYSNVLNRTDPNATLPSTTPASKALPPASAGSDF